MLITRKLEERYDRKKHIKLKELRALPLVPSVFSPQVLIFVWPLIDRLNYQRRWEGQETAPLLFPPPPCRVFRRWGRPLKYGAERAAGETIVVRRSAGFCSPEDKWWADWRMGVSKGLSQEGVCCLFFFGFASTFWCTFVLFGEERSQGSYVNNMIIFCALRNTCV